MRKSQVSKHSPRRRIENKALVNKDAKAGIVTPVTRLFTANVPSDFCKRKGEKEDEKQGSPHNKSEEQEIDP